MKIDPPVTDPAERRNAEEIQKRVEELGPWFHNLRLNGIETAPRHFLGDYPRNKWNRLSRAIPGDLEGASVLDIGCNAGFYSIEMKRRNAGRVLAIDTEPAYLAQARFAAGICGADIEFRRMSVFDLASLDEKFDWVLFMGVFYHLRYPLLALDVLAEHVVGGHMVFQSMLRGAGFVDPLNDDYPITALAHFDSPGYPKMHFVENRYARDPTNWWIPNRACVEAMLRSAGFEILSRPEDETYICQRRTRD